MSKKNNKKKNYNLNKFQETITFKIIVIFIVSLMILGPVVALVMNLL